jgi:hypothetical protein
MKLNLQFFYILVFHFSIKNNIPDFKLQTTTPETVISQKDMVNIYYLLQLVN